MSSFTSVDAFLDSVTDGQREQIEFVRTIVLASDPSVTEHIKWNSPSFCFAGEDRITVNLSRSGQLRLIFHAGTTRAEDRSAPPAFVDDSGLLDWVSDIRAICAFTSLEHIQRERTSFESLIVPWLKAFPSA